MQAPQKATAAQIEALTDWHTRVAVLRALRWIRNNGIAAKPPRHITEKIRIAQRVAMLNPEVYSQ